MQESIMFMFSIIGSVVSGTALPKEPDNVNWEHILKIALKHNIANIIGYAVSNSAYQLPVQIKEAFVKKVFERVLVSENQNAEICKVIDAFEKNGIDYMPVKGIILRNIYPSADMRFMSDADILIKREQFDKINSIMLELGYEFEAEGPIEYNYIKAPYMHFELHTALIAPSSEDLSEYYSNVWNFAKKTDIPNRYEMSIEDHFIFIFNHFVRHYRDAGVGIRPVIDLWLYIKKFPEMNMEYINRQLESLGLIKFFENVIKLMRVCFENDTIDKVTAQMIEFILDSGTFGHLQNAMAAKTIRSYDEKDLSKAEKYKYLRLVFPKMKYMRELYPTLVNFPVLLPMFWVIRIIKAVIYKRKSFQAHKTRTELIKADNMISYFNHMNDVGLDIYNGRKK